MTEIRHEKTAHNSIRKRGIIVNIQLLEKLWSTHCSGIHHHLILINAFEDGLVNTLIQLVWLIFIIK